MKSKGVGQSIIEFTLSSSTIIFIYSSLQPILNSSFWPLAIFAQLSVLYQHNSLSPLHCEVRTKWALLRDPRNGASSGSDHPTPVRILRHPDKYCRMRAILNNVIQINSVRGYNCWDVCLFFEWFIVEKVVIKMAVLGVTGSLTFTVSCSL